VVDPTGARRGRRVAIRVGYVLAFRDPYEPGADASYFHLGGRFLAEGHGFINGIGYGWTSGRLKVPSAFHPPAYTVFLALPSWLGFDRVLDHQIATSLLGTATVVVVGLLGRRVAGPRAGLFAAAVAAVYPNLWFSDVFLMSETLSVLAVAVALLLAYRSWPRPTPAHMAALGVVCGVAALTRAENVFLAPLLAGGVVLIARDVTWRRRLCLLMVAGLATVVSLAPWVLYNHGRFERPVYLSTGLGNLLATSNCDQTYHGSRLGSYYGACQPAHAAADESQAEYVQRKQAWRYISDHLGRLPVVAAARAGRTWGLYRPLQVIRLDHLEPQEPRELPTAWLGLAMYYALAGASIFGIFLLRRRRIPVLPLLVPMLLVTIVAMATNGQTRYRASAEVSLIVLASVAASARAGSKREEAPPLEPG